jgi:processive 1,2-diacylglycerol beta-glucosyltransferase
MGQTKRVLILAVRFGSGHWQTGLSLKKALLDAYPDLEVEVVNYLKFAGWIFDVTIRFVYQDLMIRVPILYRRFFRYTDQAAQNSLFQKFIETCGAPAFILYAKRRRPDLIISTYPVPSAAVAWLKKRHQLKCPLVTVITDYVLHQTWVQPDTDLYVVPNETVAGELVRRGAPVERVAVTGIPIDPRFTRTPDHLPKLLADLPEQLRQLPLVLVINGATNFGGDLDRMCRLLADLPTPLVAVVLGVRFPKLRLNLRRIVNRGWNKVFIVGYSREVPLFMASASCLISKAGGSTISEALAAEVPILIYRALPCQEELNRDYLVHEGAAVVAQNLPELGQLLGEVLQNGDLHLRMQVAATRLRHPGAANAAVKAIASRFELRAGIQEAAGSEVTTNQNAATAREPVTKGDETE